MEDNRIEANNHPMTQALHGDDTEKLRLQKEIETLNARLRNESVDGEVVTPLSDGLCLIIKGESFECRRVGTTWQMMQFSKAQQAANIRVPKETGHAKDCECHADKRRKELEDKRNDAGMLMLSALHDVAMVLLKPAERDRFREFMSDQGMTDEGIDPGELEEAIGKTIAAASGESGKAGGTTQAPSSDSSTTTNANAPHDLSSKGTAEIVTPGVS